MIEQICQINNETWQGTNTFQQQHMLVMPWTYNILAFLQLTLESSKAIKTISKKQFIYLDICF